MAQTGPAKRGDTETIKRHIQMLDNQLEKQKIYQLLSESINKRS